MNRWLMVLSAAAVAVLSAAAVAVGGFGPLLARSAQAAKASPPNALTTYGRDVWNLEALLRNSFGTRRVYLDHRRCPRARPGDEIRPPPPGSRCQGGGSPRP
jgi:hypothetical protein